MGRIDRIELSNFKSYKGRQIIGPFKNFTCVIGPNGAGKSNLMDAVSFVLGVRTGQLRGSNLSQLIYTVPGETAAKGRNCYVSIVYNTGTEHRPGRDIVFSRMIKPDGGSEYRIDNKVVSAEKYNNELENIDIIVKTRNFLVFQGDVESIASKNPKELTALIEQISGSADIRERYDQARQEKEEAEENAMFAFQKKKGISAERKQYKEQKEEAERFTSLQDEQTSLRRDHIVLQLHHIEKNIRQLHAEIDKAVVQSRETTEKKGRVDEQLKTIRKKQAALQKEAIDIEKKMNAAKAKMEEKRPEQIKVREEVLRTTRRVESNTTSLSTIRKEYEAHKELLQNLEQELRDLEQAAKDFEQRVRKESEKEKTDLAKVERHLEEYTRLKDEAGKLTAGIKRDLDGLQRQQKVDQEALESQRAKSREVEGRLNQITETRKKLVERREKGVDAITKAEASQRQLTTQIADLEKEKNESSKAQAQLTDELEELQASLREMKSDRRENDRDVRIGQAIESMKRLFPGVKGKMTDLVQPTQRRYNVAVTVAMGRYMDSIIVEDERTARDCIQYMRDQRVGTATFLPLDSLRAKPLNERLRQLPSAKLVIDVIKYDAALQQAILFAVGNTLVCENLADARRIAFESGDRHKVVTLQGVLIQKSGLISGGLQGVETRAHKWDEKQVDKLKKRRDRILRDLADVGKSLKAETQLQQLAQQLQAVEGRIKYTTVDVKMTDEKIATSEKDEKVLRAEVAKIGPQVERLERSVQDREKSVEETQRRLMGEEEEVFRAFSEKVGVKNVREWEEKRLAQLQQRAQKRMEFTNMTAKLRNQIQYEQKRDMRGPLEKLEKQIAGDQAALTNLRAQEQKADAGMEKMQTQMNSQRKAHQEAKTQVDDLELEVKEMKKRLYEVETSLATLNKEITAKETLVDQSRARRHTLYRQSKVEEVELPRQTRPKSSRRTRQTKDSLDSDEDMDDAGDDEEEEEEEDELETMDVDSISLSQDTQGSSGSGSVNAREMHRREDAIRIDFSGVEGRYKIRNAKEYDDAISNIIKRIADVTSEADKIAPNLRANERLENVDARLKSTNVEFDSIRQKAKDASDAFNQIKQERYTLFTDAFNKIADNIEAIYKELTGDLGTAYLNVDSPDEPYLHGIKYTAMPPSKRFRDMDQLSGGEKTVAALALLFAIHKFRPAPFFVLDEVDAALDNVNVERVARFIRKHSPETQYIVISLKDNFFEKSEGLVGIARDHARSSTTYTLDLSEFPEEVAVR
eukprot:TRINITY_DN4486_c0_g1_i1.p1 TRINITY_DN4486_c0_g1~~TRINITY_DN4486_c0_g1_i1.p1  ORF type:complete len:1283 (-),score=481.18 TRINITY_DN4486_c0_g1_i1:40-3828(-)